MEPVQEDRDGLLLQLLYGQLQSMGWLPDAATPVRRLRDAMPLRETHGRWLEESLRILTRAGRVAFDGAACRALAGRADPDAAWRAWERHVQASRDDAAERHASALVDATLRALPEILSGRRLATDVVFPDGSMALVECVYRDNPVSDHFNEALADCVDAHLDARLRDAPDATVRILEIGAGTGGTSVSVFRRLRRYAAQVAEYCYTDLSKAFLFHAEAAYGPAHPYLTYRTLDIGAPLAAQGIALAGYDLVIATNVLHATPDVRRSVRNAKAALRPGGLLLLNELSDKRLYSHLTFGLLDGWWLYEDPALRIEGSPVLAPDTWRFVLEQEGFRAVRFPAHDALAQGQQIVAAASDGVIRQAHAATPVARPAPEPVRAAATSAPAVQARALGALRDTVAASVGAVLRSGAAEIDLDQPFSDYGLDSILGVTLVRRLNEQLGIRLNSTSVFDYCSVNALARHAETLRGTPARAAAAAARPAPAHGGGAAAEDVRAAVLDCLSTVLRVRAEDIDSDAPFSDYGLDSILGVNFVRLLNERLAVRLPTTSLFDYSSVRGLVAHLDGLRPADPAPMPASAPMPAPARMQAGRAVAPELGGAAPGREPIAVIGMSGRYAKSRNLDQLWQHLENGVDLVEDVTRWDLSRHLEGTANCETGSFLDTIDEFDPLFFNISGIEATYMDPQQRIFLEEAWTALEDAGYAGASMAGRRCGVYVGCGDVEYASLLPDAPPAHAMWGTATSIIPARIAYYLNLQGPAIAIDTACSSSLVATHLACQALWNGETELALAGGVFLMCTPNVYKIANRSAMLSPTGQCFTFDDRADGFVPGEGVGVVVLKRLSDALADGDTIHGVIRGSGINQDGATNGITAPSALSQERLERQVYDTFGIDPAGIQMVEAHGTGTKLGDPIEYQALTQAFRAYTDKREYCAIGSIKTNLGHTTAAAGVTGLLKILLSLRHGKIPASLNYASGNTHIEFADSPFFVNTRLRTWQVDAGGKRRAALSAFGFSGTNAHLVVEEAPAVEIVPAARPGYLIVLSAKSDEQLQALVRSMRDACAARDGLQGANLSFTLLLGRQHFSRRWACVARSIDEFAALATAWLDQGRSPRVYTGRVNEKHPPEQPALQRYGNQCLAQCRDAATPERYLEELHAVAELYVQGYALDYALLFAGERHQRLSLPTYPFARERYWVPASAAPSAAEAGPGLHPLVQRNTSDFSVQRYGARFNGAEHFLADHVVRGRKMLPAVAYLEMARAAACLADGAHAGSVRLSHVVWARPIVVDDAPLDVQVELVPQEDGGIAYRIGRDAQGGMQVHGEGRVLLDAAASLAGGTLDLAALRQACATPVSAAQCYALYRRMGLDYGRAHQSIESLYVGDGQVLGRLVLPQAVAETREQYVLHPSVMDGALQALAGLLRDEWEATGRSSLPFAVDQVDVLDGCAERMWVWARFSAGSGPAARVRKFDLDVCDDAGRVCVRLRGFATRVMEEAVEPASTGVDIETLMLRPVWEAERVAARADLPAYSEHLVLLVGGQTDVAALSSQLNARCEILSGDYASQAEALMTHVQALLRVKHAGPVLIQVVVPASGAEQVSAGLSGLLKSAKLEQPKLIGQLIEVEREDDAVQLAIKLKENRSTPHDAQIRYAEGERQVLRWHEVEETLPEQPWKAGGVYLITGGLGGLGRIFANEIAARAPGATLILSGRSALGASGREQLRELEARGATVEYRELDVSNRDAVRQAVLEIQEAHAGLNGIVHAAGVLRDGLLMHKTVPSLHEVLSPKVAGLVNLDEASRDIELDCFLCFSSLTAVWGNTGQTDYAAANGFMDAFATYRNSQVAMGRRHGRTLSLNWPLWREGGMQVDASVERALADATGMVAMSNADGIDALFDAWGSGRDQVMVAAGHAARILSALARPAATAASAHAPVAAVAPEAVTDLSGKTARYLCTLCADVLHLPPEKIEIDAPLEKYGIDSILVMSLTRALEHIFGPLSKTLFFEYQTLQELAGYFVAHHAGKLASLLATPVAPAPAAPAAGTAPVAARGAARRLDAARTLSRRTARPGAPASHDEIAIVGVAGRYPQADDLAAFWDNLRGGVDSIVEVPSDRWDHSRYFDPDKERAGKTYAKWGGFIGGVDEFDPRFFNIAPSEAERIDPQERLFLQCAYAALEDAGYTREALAQCRASGMPGNVGVYVGVMYEEYQLYAAQQQLLGHGTTVMCSPSSIANRVSYFLNLHGPSLAVDTMCSSSLTTVHLACEALRRGDCEMAIAGGVNVSIHPNKYLVLANGKFASSKGLCESFGQGGDGYVPGEGVGAVILKPLAQAIADGDHIHGVIRATSINHGGKTNGYSVPNPVAQANVIARALKAAAIHPRTISYIEAHGTGTSLGDPIEITGLGKAFDEAADALGVGTPERQYCALGSVKSNIGHAESAAGVAGLTKVLLQMRHGLLAPSLHARTLNPNITFEETPFVVQQELAEWKRPVLDGREYPRIAGVSSFGAGGSNAHVIVEEYRDSGTVAGYQLPDGQPALVVLSARNGERLRERVRQLADALERGEITDANLADAAYTLQVGREAMDERLAVLAGSAQVLADKLRAVLAGDTRIDGVYRGEVRKHREELSLLASDEDLSEVVSGWLAKGKHGKLLEMWVKGFGVEWARLYGEHKPSRISLPTYPFAKERCWLPEVPMAAVDMSRAVAGLHPLVQRNTSDLDGLRYSTVFDGAAFFLSDHRVQGRKVLPGVAYLEMVRAALGLADGGDAMTRGVRLSQVVWSRPLVVEGGPVEAQLGLYPEEDGTLTYEVYGEDASGPVTYSQGRVERIEAGEPERLDVESLRAQCGVKAWAAEACYARFSERGLQYGPAHRAIENLYAGEGQVLGRLVLPSAVSDTREQYVLHPSVMDGALQAVAGVLGEEWESTGRSSVPFAVDQVDVLDGCAERMWVWARFSAGSGPAARMRKFDLDVCDDAGRVCVRMRGFTARVIEEAAESALTAADTETLLLHPAWETAHVTENAEALAYSEHLVLLVGGQTDATALSSQLNARCEILSGDYASQAEALMAHVQSLLRAKHAGPVLIQVVVPAFGAEQVSAGLSGLLKSAKLEQPKLIGQLIEVEREEDAIQLAIKLKENRATPDDAQIRYAEGERQVLRWHEVEETLPEQPWKAGGVYLITGGLGGLGRIFANEIAARAPGATLVLSGRSALGEAGREQLRELEARGATVEYRELDVSNRDAVRQAVLEIQETHAGLNGIVHAAGVLRDGLLMHKTASSLHEVLSPKVAGLMNLDEASRDIGLDCFICFSSLTAVWGNTGQTDYAAANGFMDAFATYRNSQVAMGRRHGRTLSLNWPLWREGGMQVDASVERALADATGMVPMSNAHGIDALYRAWSSGFDQVATAEGDRTRISRLFGLDVPVPAATGAVAPASVPARTSTADTHSLRDKIRQLLSESISALLKVRLEDIDPDAEFNDYGFESVSLTQFGNRLNQAFGTRIAPTLFFEYPTLNSFAGHLADAYQPLFAERFSTPAQPAPAAPRTDTPAASAAPAAPARASALRPRRAVAPALGRATAAREPVAIIGISCRFPQAADLDAFWRNLSGGRDSITEVPADRWDWQAIYGDPKTEDNRTNAKWGGFIDGIGDFDPLFFGISPKEAELMDPQQRLLMMHVWNTLEDAGYAAAGLAGSQTALFAGTYGTGYGDLIKRAQVAIDGYSSTGTVPSVGPNRMSYFLDFHGPSEPVETACSSSLVAIHRGVQAIENGECELAIVGGVNTVPTPDATISFSRAGMLSTDGRCKTFSDQANGYVRGEGVGMLLLKRLSAAERDGDHIYGLIRGTAENHGGKANSLTAPNPHAQAALIKTAIRRAGVDPATIGYIEAHGTGTPLGDPIEINGLKMAFRDLNAEAGHPDPAHAHCGIGSVKTNIGHLELAAGIAGVIKVLLQMRHRTLAPSLHCDTLNPYVELDGSPFYVVREKREWLPVHDAAGRPLPRRAGVSSFGFGGVNAHVVLEEYVPSAVAAAAGDAHPALIVLSARNAERLQARVQQLLDAVRQGVVNDRNLTAAAYTLQGGRDAMAQRLAFVAPSAGQLAATLEAIASGRPAPDGVWQAEVRRQNDELSVFGADEDLDRALDAWLAKGKYHKLLELWVKGLAFDWRRLYGAHRPTRISLPAYPFAQERYWIEASAGAAAPSAAPREHVDDALLGRLLDGLLDDSVSVDTAARQARRAMLS